MPATVVMGGSMLQFARVTLEAVPAGDWFCSMSINERYIFTDSVMINVVKLS